MESSNKVSVLCRYGGRFVEECNEVSYKDGTNRIILVAPEIDYHGLASIVCDVSKLTDICSFKYLLPPLGFNCLVSVMKDEDVSNMIETSSTIQGPIQLFVSGAEKTLSNHNAISSDEEVTQAAIENSHGSTETPPQHIPNININADTGGPSDLQGMDDFGMDNHESPCDNADGCVTGSAIMKLEEDQEFSDVDAFHKFLRKYAICSNFEYKRTRSGNGHFAAKCREPKCSWRIQASQLLPRPTFKIKTLKGNHTCNMDKQLKVSNTIRHHQATRRWIADIIECENYFEFEPKVIVQKIKRKYGIEVSYNKAWRGKDLARKRKTAGYREQIQEA